MRAPSSQTMAIVISGLLLTGCNRLGNFDEPTGSKRPGGGRTSASDPMKGYIPTARVQAPSVRSVAKAPPPLDIVDPAQVGPDRQENVVVVGTDPANPSR